MKKLMKKNKTQKQKEKERLILSISFGKIIIKILS